MIAFILKVSLCWLFFYGIYELFLKKKTFFNANRSYLLITLVIGIILPLLEFIPWKNESNMSYMIYPMLAEIDDLQAVVASGSEDKFNWMNVLYAIYGLGFSLSMFRFSMGLGKIVKLFRKSEKKKQAGYTMVLTDEKHLPFSFFRWVFFSRQTTLTEEVDRILMHEIEHIKGKHSFDVLATEFLKVVFWCSPMIYLYRNALKEVHEYLADHVVVKDSDKLSYKRLLLDQTNSGLQMALTHQFFNSHLKNRLKMISQKRSGRPTLVMYALGIPVLLLLMFAFTFSYNGDEPSLSADEISEYSLDLEKYEELALMMQDTVPVRSKDASEVREIFKVVEEMPRFPGCEDSGGSLAEIDKCSKQKMLEFIYGNLKYPAAARDAGLEGMSVIKFVVAKDGSIGDIEIVRKLSKEIDEASKAVVDKMNAMGIKWNPGYQRGKAVDVQYMLPIRYKLSDEEKADLVVEEKAVGTTVLDGEIFKVVEEMPRFPGCEGMEGSVSEIEDCAKQKMLEHIYMNLKYPKEDREKGIQGMAVVQFVVDKSGEVRDFRIVRSISEQTNTEVIKVIESMNGLPQKWTPGKQRGKAVNVLYTLPVRFKLQGDDVKKEVGDNPPPPPPPMMIVESESKANRKAFLNGEAYYPIYIVDGKEVEPAVAKSIPQDQIEKRITYAPGMSIGIEKFGARASAGVFEIITKSEKERKLHITTSVPKVIVTDKESSNGVDLNGATKAIKVVHLDGKVFDGKLEDIDPESIATVTVRGEKVGGAEVKVVDVVTKGNAKPGAEDEIPKSNDVQKEITITGHVKDVNGKPLIGANIIARSLSTGTVSDVQGSFRLKVPTGTALDFEYVGYTAVTVNIGSNNNVSVVLAKSDGTDGKKSTTTILEGEAAIEMQNKPKEEVQIIQTISDGKQPLFIVDGIEFAGLDSGKEFLDLDPNSIEEISIVKGEKAVEAYGTKGINGVVLVTTKNPRKTKKAMKAKKAKKAQKEKQEIVEETEVKVRLEGKVESQLDLNKVSVFPNPARESINISFEAAAKPTTIHLIDIDGKLLQDFSDRNFNGKFEKTIDLKNITSKLVLLRVEQEGKMFTKKIMIE